MPPAINNASQIKATTGISTTAGDVFAANPNRRWFLIQNLDTHVLYVKLGTGASATDFNFVLKAGTGAADGLGGQYESQVLVFTGIISVFSSTPSFVATEI